MYAPEVAWRETARNPRLWGIDARGMYPLVFLGLHISEITFFTAVLSIAFLWLAERMGYSPEVLMRRLRSRLAGKRRPAVDPASWRRNLRL